MPLISFKMLIKFALLLVSVCAISAQVLPPSFVRRIRPGPTIFAPSGPVQGQEETYDLFRRIYTFKGIRYGQPPVGNLRFRQAVSPPPRQITQQAWDYGAECPQFSLLLNRIQGDEDCLFLNVATPTNIRAQLPVVVAVHGGGLQFGNGEISFLGPELINRENVIFVSFNYRLNVLGFLNTGDASSPGNYGLKDMVLVLRWVQDNIADFGGDRNDVTIMGISGGAVAVHALVVSPVTTGLFHKALSQSGSLFNGWAFNRQPLANAQMLARNLQLQYTNNIDLVNQLRQVSTERLLNAAGINHDRNPRLFDALTFMPSIDPFDSTEPRILPLPIAFLIRNGAINNVTYMIGFNSAESMYAVRDVMADATILERFNQNPNLLIPPEWELLPNSIQALEVINVFRVIYFGGAQNITVEHAHGWSQYVSDREFIFGISKQARLHQIRQRVFYFKFNYSGALSFAQRALGLAEVPGAMHGDDAFYLFRLNRAVTPVLPGDEAYAIQRRHVRLWTNFFRFGDPTPTLMDPLINAMWPPMTMNNDFLDIGLNLQPDVHPFANRLDAWRNFDERFNSDF